MARTMTDTPGPQHPLRPPERTQVRWKGGFWADRQEMVRNESLQSVMDAIEDPGNAAYFGNFTNVAQGRREFHGRYWSDGDCYKVIETILLLIETQPDPELSDRLENMVNAVAAAQESDGYINTQITLTDLERWSDIEHHELYNFGHLFTAACLHHQIAGTTKLLDVARRAADYLHDTFSTREPDLARFGFNPSQIMGLVELYREAGEEKYLDLAKIFVENRGAHPDQPGNNGDQSQARVPLQEETEAVGHAVTGPYLWAGAADIVMERDEPALQEAITRIWEDSTYRKMYITGGIGALHKGTSERSHPRYEQIAESYGRPYQLPNDSAYNETCANIANAMWSWRMLQLTGEARYADVMEQVLYNSGLSGVSLSGTQFNYSNPLRFNGDDQFIGNNDSPRRWTRWTCYCCPPQVTRTLAGLRRWAYSIGDSSLWVNLYGANVIDAGSATNQISVSQNTKYPWDGDVELTIDEAPSTTFTVHLRIPGWSKATQISVNGAPEKVPSIVAHYHSITRVWKRGDRITLSLDMRPKVYVGRPEVEEIRNQGAVMAGPLVYCLEGEDLPEGLTINDVAIDEDARFEPAVGAGIFQGMTVLNTELARRPSWGSDALYKPITASLTETVATQLIPYFAWNNRDDNTMSVWLPLKG